MMHRRAHTLGVSALRTSLFARLFVIPLTLVALLSGCAYNEQTTVGPGTLWHPTDRVRVTYDTGTATRVVVLTSAGVVGDSLIGARHVGNDYERPQRLAIALEDITRVEKRNPGADKWVLGAVVLAATVGFGLAVMSDFP